MFSDRQLSYPLAGRGKDSVTDCRRDHGHTRLAHARGRLLALYEMDVRLKRSFINARHRVIVKIRLLDLALSRRDLAHQGDACAEYRRSFELRLHAVGVDHSARIHRDVYAR